MVDGPIETPMRDRLLRRTQLIIRTPATPTCPHCLRSIPESDFVVTRGIVVCRPCITQGHHVSRKWWGRVLQLGLVAHFTSASGLHLFTPQVDWPARTPLHLVLGLTDLHQVARYQRAEAHARAKQGQSSGLSTDFKKP